MKRNIIALFAGVSVVFAAINFACSKSSSDSTGGSNTGGDGQDSILLNIGNNIIIPSYTAALQSVTSLDSAVTDFNASPNATKLGNVQQLFKTAYTAWEYVSEYDYFGPALGSQPAITTINIFPVNTSLIDANISEGDNSINTFANTAAKGFGALDYLFFGSDNGTLLNKFTTDALAANRKSYVTAVSADIKSIVAGVVNNWLPSGRNYIKEFVDDKIGDKSQAGSLSSLMNSSEQDFEILKNDRLGIPLGKIPVGSSLPINSKEVEALYSGISNQLSLAQLQAVEGLYFGNSKNGNVGLINYLLQAEKANSNLKYNGGLLSDTIRTNFTKAEGYLKAIPDPLSANLSNSNALAAFNTCQYLVTLTKADMIPDIGLQVTYGDNDGD